jgi:hypothetical protein
MKSSLVESVFIVGSLRTPTSLLDDSRGGKKKAEEALCLRDTTSNRIMCNREHEISAIE